MLRLGGDGRATAALALARKRGLLERSLDARAEDADEIRGGKCRALEATTNVSGTQN